MIIYFAINSPDTSVDFTSISDSFVSITGVVHYYFGDMSFIQEIGMIFKSL